MLQIIETFADLWDELPLQILGRHDYRKLILRTRLVPYAVVRGQLSPVDDGAVELYDIEVDLVGLPGVGEGRDDDDAGGVDPGEDE